MNLKMKGLCEDCDQRIVEAVSARNESAARFGRTSWGSMVDSRRRRYQKEVLRECGCGKGEEVLYVGRLPCCMKVVCGTAKVDTRNPDSQCRKVK